MKNKNLSLDLDWVKEYKESEDNTVISLIGVVLVHYLKKHKQNSILNSKLSPNQWQQENMLFKLIKSILCPYNLAGNQ